jgi:hypothetical protein
MTFVAAHLNLSLQSGEADKAEVQNFAGGGGGGRGGLSKGGVGGSLRSGLGSAGS